MCCGIARGTVKVSGLTHDSLQGDAEILRLLQDMGCAVGLDKGSDRGIPEITLL
jgi:hypothetical protein